MLWFKYQSHGYMDPNPEVGYRMFNSLEAARRGAKHIQKKWGGICTILGYATMDEVLEYVRMHNIPLDAKTEADVVNPDNYFVDRGQADVLLTLIMHGFTEAALRYAFDKIKDSNVFMEAEIILDILEDSELPTPWLRILNKIAFQWETTFFPNN